MTSELEKMGLAISAAMGYHTKGGVPARSTHSWLRQNLWTDGSYVEHCLRCGVYSNDSKAKFVCSGWS